MTEVKLSPKQIVEKRFKTAIKGYNAKEVDAFLDEIIQDYEAYEKTIADLKSENKRLIDQIDNNSGVKTEVSPKETAQSVTPVSSVTGSLDNSAPGTTYYDILKRLSNLERHVFGQSATVANTVNYAKADDQRQPIVNSSDQLPRD